MLRIIGGSFQGHPLKTPKTNRTRPTQSSLREAVFNICQNEIKGASFLDLFAGTGAMGFEALSRGAKNVCFVENQRSAIACIRENIEKLSVQDRTKIFSVDALASLGKMQEKFDIIYIDPPYDREKPFPEKILELIKRRSLLKEEGTLFIEIPTTKIDLTELPFSLRKSRKYGNTTLLECE